MKYKIELGDIKDDRWFFVITPGGGEPTEMSLALPHDFLACATGEKWLRWLVTQFCYILEFPTVSLQDKLLEALRELGYDVE